MGWRDEATLDRYDRGMCPACNRGPFLLTKNGTLRHHGGEKSTKWPYQRPVCPGSGEKPKGD